SLAKSTTVTVTQSSSTLTISGDLDASASGVSVLKLGAGLLQVKHVRADGLSINEGNMQVLSNGGDSGVSNVKSLSIAGLTNAWTSKLDLNNNSLVVDYSGSSPISTIANQIKTGYAGGLWNGNGIASSAAAAAGNTALGYAEASDALGPSGGTFKGQTV